METQHVLVYVVITATLGALLAEYKGRGRWYGFFIGALLGLIGLLFLALLRKADPETFAAEEEQRAADRRDARQQRAEARARQRHEPRREASVFDTPWKDEKQDTWS